MNYEKYKKLIIAGFGLETYEDIIRRWNEPHRFYHNIDHLNYLIKLFEQLYADDKIDGNLLNKLIIVAFFHDVIYDPSKTNNEEKSIEYFVNNCGVTIVASEEFKKEISGVIMDTKGRTKPTTWLSKTF